MVQKKLHAWFSHQTSHKISLIQINENDMNLLLVLDTTEGNFVQTWQPQVRIFFHQCAHAGAFLKIMLVEM
jgi:hypothetical protein